MTTDPTPADRIRVALDYVWEGLTLPLAGGPADLTPREQLLVDRLGLSDADARAAERIAAAGAQIARARFEAVVGCPARVLAVDHDTHDSHPAAGPGPRSWVDPAAAPRGGRATLAVLGVLALAVTLHAVRRWAR